MPTLRPFQPGDLPALYAIALATGHRGGDAAPLHRDGELIGHIYAAPYALLAPGIAWVAEDGEGVAGYAVGACDTAAWEALLERRWWPALRRRLADPGETPAPDWTWDQRRVWQIHRPVATPPAVAVAYPGHMHMNLMPRAQGQGLGARLLAAWLDAAAACGAGITAGGVHVGVNAGNARGLRFWARQGFEIFTPDGVAQGRTVWMGRGWRTDRREGG